MEGFENQDSRVYLVRRGYVDPCTYVLHDRHGIELASSQLDHAMYVTCSSMVGHMLINGRSHAHS